MKHIRDAKMAVPMRRVIRGESPRSREAESALE